MDAFIPTNPRERLTGPVGRHEIARLHSELPLHFRSGREQARVVFRIDGILLTGPDHLGRDGFRQAAAEVVQRIFQVHQMAAELVRLVPSAAGTRRPLGLVLMIGALALRRGRAGTWGGRAALQEGFFGDAGAWRRVGGTGSLDGLERFGHGGDASPSASVWRHAGGAAVRMPASRRGAAGRAEALALSVGHVVAGHGEHGPVDVHGVGVDVIAVVVQVRAGDLNSGAHLSGVSERISGVGLLVGEKVTERQLVRELRHGVVAVRRRMNAGGCCIGDVVGGGNKLIS